MEHLGKLNNLLNINYEIEKIYLEALENVTDDNLKTFFRARGYERLEFGNELRLEIEKFGGVPIHSGLISNNGLYKIWMNFKNLVLMENEGNLLDEVYKLKELNVEQYNNLLREMNVPLSICKLLVKQRDAIEATMNAIKRHEAFVA